MNYSQHYLNAREAYAGGAASPPDLDDFYAFSARVLPDRTDAGSLPRLMEEYFGRQTPVPGEPSVKYAGDIHSLGLNAVADRLVPLLERELYGCRLFVDKVCIYRNVFTPIRQSSWLWHYDNNPREVYKMLIYLTDVDESCAPFQYLEGAIQIPTRQGPQNWAPAPDNSRLSDEAFDRLVQKGHHPVTVCGKVGTTIVFNPNCVHRATIPARGRHRDILAMRVRPTIEKLPRYIDPEWTTSFELPGTLPRSPFERRLREGKT